MSQHGYKFIKATDLGPELLNLFRYKTLEEMEEEIEVQDLVSISELVFPLCKEELETLEEEKEWELVDSVDESIATNIAYWYYDGERSKIIVCNSADEFYEEMGI